MRILTLKTVFQKEMREILRDRRTLFIMLVFPVIVYPLMTIGMTMLTSRQIKDLSSRPFSVEWSGDSLPLTLIQKLEAHELITLQENQEEQHENPPSEISIKCKMVLLEAAGYVNYELEVFFHSADDLVQVSANTLLNLLHEYAGETLDIRLQTVDFFDEAFFSPVRVNTHDLSSAQEAGGNIMGRALGGIVVMMALLGAFYPAVDMGAGERERGTLEPLLMACPDRMPLLVGKFLAVFVVCTATCLANLASLALTFATALSMTIEGPGGQGFISLSWIAAAFGLLVPTAALFAASSLLVSLYAKSVKEAQTLLTPKVLIAAGLSMVPMLPGVSLEGVMLWIPVANSALLIKEVLRGSLDPVYGAIVIIETGVLTFLMLKGCSRLLASENALYPIEPTVVFKKEKTASIQKDIRAMNVTSLLACLGMALALNYYISGFSQSLDQKWQMILTQMGGLLLPAVLAVLLARQPMEDVFPSEKLKRGDIFTTIFLALLVTWIVTSVFSLQQKLFPIPEDFGQIQYFKTIARAGNFREFIQTLLVLALVPAICEETLFRGLIQRNLQAHLGIWHAVWVTALLFGVFHLSIYRLLPTALAGLFFCVLMAKKRNLSLCMLAHFTYNATMLIIFNVSSV